MQLTREQRIAWKFPVKSHLRPREGGGVNDSGGKGGEREPQYDPNLLKK